MVDEPPVWRLCRLMVTLIDEVRGLREDLAGRRATPRTISPEDMATLARLLPQILELTGGANFTVHALLRKDAAAFRDTLARCGLSSRQLGRLLARASSDADFDAGGLYVDAFPRKRDGVTFCVVAESRESRMATSFATTMRAKLAK